MIYKMLSLEILEMSSAIIINHQEINHINLISAQSTCVLTQEITPDMTNRFPCQEYSNSLSCEMVLVTCLSHLWSVPQQLIPLLFFQMTVTWEVYKFSFPALITNESTQDTVYILISMLTRCHS